MSLTRKQYELMERRLLKVAEKITKRPERYNPFEWLFARVIGEPRPAWPTDLAGAYLSAKSPAGRARVGVRAIKRYLAERRKEVEG